MTGMAGYAPTDFPLEPNLKLLSSKEEEILDKGRYQRLVGKLIYLSHTRPDIAFSLSW